MYWDKHRIIVTHGEVIYAYSEDGNVYIIDNDTQKFVRIKEKRSVNELLSEMLKSYENIQNWEIEPASVTPPTTVKGLIKMEII
jgi:translation elongation factor P/translation initiation factor 5A